VTDRVDKFVQMLERVAHALRMGVLVTGVAIGSVAVFWIVNRPDDAPAEAMFHRLREGPAPVAAFAPRDWTHVCLGARGEDVRVRMRAETGHPARECAGDNAWTALYDPYAEIGFAAPFACRIVPVHRDLFRPAREGEARCEARRGLMYLSLDGPPGGETLKLTRR